MKRGPSSARAKQQGGYALLLVVFLTALVLISAMAVGLRIRTEGQREKEEDMIWRGKQYTRAIKLYYRKFGRFPTSMDNLIKPQTGNIRFMRQAYKDPMNKEDGSWRFIYVGPAGQLIGSLKPPTSLQLPTAGRAPGIAPLPVTGLGSAPPPGSGIGLQGSAPGAAGTSTPTTGTGTGAVSTDTSGSGTDGQNIPMGDTPTIVGGNIIGVGSKINQSSIITYEKASNYRLFEFIWDPSKDMGMISSQGTPIGTPAGSPGTNPTGAPPNPANATPNPPPNPNPNPQ